MGKESSREGNTKLPDFYVINDPVTEIKSLHPPNSKMGHNGLVFIKKSLDKKKSRILMLLFWVLNAV
jgi:hypothetical protein